jgi:hypothetical protein
MTGLSLSAPDEHRWQIQMPWKKRVYAINWDEMRRGRPVLFIAWRIEFGALILRAGWIYWWDDA